jgi:hypothetical protein
MEREHYATIRTFREVLKRLGGDPDVYNHRIFAELRRVNGPRYDRLYTEDPIKGMVQGKPIPLEFLHELIGLYRSQVDAILMEDAWTEEDPQHPPSPAGTRDYKRGGGDEMGSANKSPRAYGTPNYATGSQASASSYSPRVYKRGGTDEMGSVNKSPRAYRTPNYPTGSQAFTGQSSAYGSSYNRIVSSNQDVKRWDGVPDNM